MSNGSDTVPAYIVGAGILYWFAMAAAYATFFAAFGAVIGVILLIVYLGMAGVAYFKAFQSGSVARILDSIAAPLLGVACGAHFGPQPGIISFFDSWGRGGGLLGIITLLGALAFFIGGFLFPILVTSPFLAARVAGYAVCVVWGALIGSAITVIPTWNHHTVRTHVKPHISHHTPSTSVHGNPQYPR